MTRPRRGAILPVLFLLLFAAFRGVAAAGEGGAREEEVLRVAEAFLAEGEHYRAVTEFKRFLILFPASARATDARFGVAAAFAAGDEHADAARAFARAVAAEPEGPRAPEGTFREGVSWWRAGEPQRARGAFEALTTRRSGTPFGPRAGEALALLDLEAGRRADARSRLAALAEGDDHAAAARARAAVAVVDAAGEGREKSPALAGALSAVLPGSGHLYAGRPGDAVTALAINALFVAGAVSAWRQENYALAGLVAGVGVPFYAGNIVGSANAARRWNLRLRADLRRGAAAALEFTY